MKAQCCQGRQKLADHHPRALFPGTHRKEASTGSRHASRTESAGTYLKKLRAGRFAMTGRHKFSELTEKMPPERAVLIG